jgi:hypothetical protein
MKDKRNKNMEADLKTAEQTSEATSAPKMDVTTWFSLKLKEHKKLRPAHYAAVVAFFKNKNLSEHETKDTFDKMLKSFGF